MEPKTVIVSSKEFGTKCWSSFRFIRGFRCLRVMRCTYPCKKTCRAVEAELEYLQQGKKRQAKLIDAKIDRLLKECKSSSADIFCASND